MAKKQPLYPHIPGGKKPVETSFPPKVKMYQRGADGFPIGADKIMRQAYGRIPDPNQRFYSRAGFQKPKTVHGWSWDETFKRWGAYVTFSYGDQTFTYPETTK